MSNLKELTKGILKENPIFVQFLGMCATLAVSTSVINGLGMGLSTMVVLVASNIIISLLRNFIPNKVRIAAYIIVIAGCVTAVEMALKAFLPEISKSLGIFIPLIVVNCIILGRAEAFASKNGVVKSALDGIGMGL
ncbi:MAG: electron transport complex subunit RsxE, partial [Clostridia bacterium]|nr:electron transport complex subunit RsxE [Clostridia bacterium]